MGRAVKQLFRVRFRFREHNFVQIRLSKSLCWNYNHSEPVSWYDTDFAFLIREYDVDGMLEAISKIVSLNSAVWDEESKEKVLQTAVNEATYNKLLNWILKEHDNYYY